MKPAYCRERTDQNKLTIINFDSGLILHFIFRSRLFAIFYFRLLMVFSQKLLPPRPAADRDRPRMQPCAHAHAFTNASII